MSKIPKPWLRTGRGWYVQVDGRQVPLGRDKKAAYQEYHRLMRLEPERRQVSGQSLASVVDDFLEYVFKNRAPATYRFYRDLLQKFCSLHGTMAVHQLRPFHAQRWVDGFPHLSKNSRRNHLRAVKRCLKWATKSGYLDANPVEHLELPAGERREVMVSHDEYQRLIGFASPDSLRDLITVTWETGCRPQESLLMQSRHVDVANQRWVIPKSESKGEHATRVVYLTDTAFQITRRLMLQRPTGNLFCSTTGKAWTADTVNSAFDRIRLRMGKAEMTRLGLAVEKSQIADLIQELPPIRRERGMVRPKTASELRQEAKRKLTSRLAASLVPRYSLYGLRHSWATHALERGVDSVTVAVLMGHSDPSMLAKHYQHLAQNAGFLLEQTKKATARA